MATQVVMPQLGESVTEGTILKWLVAPSSKVMKYQPLCEIMTDKVTAEIPSSQSGTITQLVAAEGQTIQVGGLICWIDEANQEEEARVDVQPVRDKLQSNHLYSPAVLYLAREHNLDLTLMKGAGKDGRITRKDVLTAIKSPPPIVERSNNPAIEYAEQAEFEEHAENSEYKESESAAPTHVQRNQVTGLPHEIHESPHNWLMVEVDVTDLSAYRNQVKDNFELKQGLKLRLLPFFIKAVVASLKKHPKMNSIWSGRQIITRQDMCISLVVAANNRLHVPVIRDADYLSVLGILQAIQHLGTRAGQGVLTIDEQQGGSFAIMNTGAIGSIQSKPNVLYPQTAILSIEQITKRAVIINNMFAARSIVNLCLSYDQRVHDVLLAGQFLQSIKHELENNMSTISLY